LGSFIRLPLPIFFALQKRISAQVGLQAIHRKILVKISKLLGYSEISFVNYFFKLNYSKEFDKLLYLLLLKTIIKI